LSLYLLIPVLLVSQLPASALLIQSYTTQTTSNSYYHNETQNITQTQRKLSFIKDFTKLMCSNGCSHINYMKVYKNLL